jgi:hypothetical protein
MQGSFRLSVLFTMCLFAAKSLAQQQRQDSLPQNARAAYLLYITIQEPEWRRYVAKKRYLTEILCVVQIVP